MAGSRRSTAEGEFADSAADGITRPHADLHLPDGPFHAHEDGPADDAVADVQLGHVVQPCDRAHVAIVQSVAGVQFQPGGHDARRRDPQGLELPGLGGPSWLLAYRPVCSSMASSSRVRAASIWAGSGSRNRATSIPASRQRFTADAIRDRWPTTSSPPSVVSSCAPLGHQRDLVRANLESHLDDVGVGRHLQVEPNLNGLAQQPEVPVLDVPAVFAKVNGDPVGAPQFGQGGCPDGVGLLPSSRLAKRGDMVDVDSQAKHGRGFLL